MNPDPKRRRFPPIPPLPPPGESSGTCEMVELTEGGLVGEWPPVRSRGKFNSDEPARLVPRPGEPVPDVTRPAG